MNMSLTAKDKLIVALDVETSQRARELVNNLRELVGMFKIGFQLFTTAGPDLVREIVRSGNRVFLDLKFHDIPNTVAAAGVEATRLGVSVFNLHAAGGSEMMRRTADAVSEAAASEGLPRPAVIAVTVLTSADVTTLSEIGINCELEQQVHRLALLADVSGMDGVVASAHDVGLVRTAVRRPDFLVVTPGVRPAQTRLEGLDDQKRVATPSQAVKAGSDFVVIGRPIIDAPDPVESARQIVAEIQAGLE
jgi:orotidine-5'-phosphate decarboxylase